LIYKVKIVEKVEDPVEKVRAIIEMDYPKDIEEFKIKPEGSKVIVKLPDRCKYDNDWERVKLFIASNILNYSGFSELEFIEYYMKPKKKSEESEKPKQEDSKKEETSSN